MEKPAIIDESIRETRLWKDLVRLKWWIDVCQLSQDGHIYPGLKFWADRWGVTKWAVKRFFDYLLKIGYVYHPQQSRNATRNEAATLKITYTDKYGIKAQRSRNTTRNEAATLTDENGTEIMTEYDQFIALVNRMLGKRYRGDQKSRSSFNAREKDNYTLADYEKALENIVVYTSHRDNNFQHITPEFVTRSDKLEKFTQDMSLKKGHSEQTRKEKYQHLMNQLK